MRICLLLYLDKQQSPLSLHNKDKFTTCIHIYSDIYSMFSDDIGSIGQVTTFTSNLTYCSRDQNSKILNHTFSIKEVVGCNEEVPTQRAEPW